MKNLNYKTMRKLVFTLLMLLTLSLSAQQYQYTVKFLGIPVDGSKSEMISQLKKKNFKYDSYNDQLTGKFNGEKVIVMIHTNNNDIVDRLYVTDSYDSNSSNIRIRFNLLLNQFKNNDNYIEFLEHNELIADSENIGYEMQVHDKRYQAAFHQERTIEEVQRLWNDSTYVKKWIIDNGFEHVWDSLYNSFSVEEYNKKAWDIFYGSHRLDAVLGNDVWFMISDFGYNKYRIVLFYDNNRNRSNGEDL